MRQVEALSTIREMCETIFANEESFCKEFNIFVAVCDDFANVSFSGRMCHVLISSATRSKNYYVDVQRVLQWMEKIGVEL